MHRPHPTALKEICLHGTKSFPCAIYQTRSLGKGTLVKHHWHDEIEILYFFGGDFRLEINMEQFFVHSEAYFSSTPASCTAYLQRVMETRASMQLSSPPAS